jgi:hypothetical protein
MHCPWVFAGTFAHDCWHCAAALVLTCDEKKPQAVTALAIAIINETRQIDMGNGYHTA